MDDSNHLLNRMLKDWRWYNDPKSKRKWRRTVKRQFTKYNQGIIEDGLDQQIEESMDTEHFFERPNIKEKFNDCCDD